MSAKMTVSISRELKSKIEMAQRAGVVINFSKVLQEGIINILTDFENYQKWKAAKK